MGCGELGPRTKPSISHDYLPIALPCIGKEGCAHSGGRLVLRIIPILEASLPIPQSPAQLKFVKGLAKRGIKTGARWRVSRGIAAELADVHRAAMTFRPISGLLQRAAK